MSDKEGVIQALVVLLLIKVIDNCSRDLRVLTQELVFKMLKLLHEHICVILKNS